ncbi:hypothetical protein [Geobacter argillaceus]|uniref:Uncharacterized protein n=1 Tax=Geobacter argillaceus TaxID=345631 RepID=A0A562VM88_9BACT|nr:hypothetical protein [Geobacter argillaceus]TWJ18884.1 hypothetical protein JN12_02335 [Geobacter argillaceus]
MDAKERIHGLLKEMSMEVLNYIRSQEASAKDRWVPAAQVRSKLELNFVAVPKNNKQYGEKGWLFAIIARLLEDQNLIEYKKIDGKAYCRTFWG